MKGEEVLAELWQVIDDRVSHPTHGSYVASLVTDQKGIDRILEKVGEETTEFIIAAKNQVAERIVSEAADLQFHLLVALRIAGVSFEDVLLELKQRRR